MFLFSHRAKLLDANTFDYVAVFGWTNLPDVIRSTSNLSGRARPTGALESSSCFICSLWNVSVAPGFHKKKKKKRMTTWRLIYKLNSFSFPSVLTARSSALSSTFISRLCSWNNVTVKTESINRFFFFLRPRFAQTALLRIPGCRAQRAVCAPNRSAAWTKCFVSDRFSCLIHPRLSSELQGSLSVLTVRLSSGFFLFFFFFDTLILTSNVSEEKCEKSQKGESSDCFSDFDSLNLSL